VVALKKDIRGLSQIYGALARRIGTVPESAGNVGNKNFGLGGPVVRNNMRILGLDVGDKTIGVAISDELGWTAQALEVIQRKGWNQDIMRIKEILNEYQVDEIIVGLPKDMRGKEGAQAKKVREFLEKLQTKVDLPIMTWDERFTTVSAERTLLEGDLSRAKRKKVIDKVAAQVILQGYLDRAQVRS